MSKLFQIGDVVTGKIPFGGDILQTGKVVKQDAGISRDAVIVELSDGKRHIMLEQAIVSCDRIGSKHV